MLERFCVLCAGKFTVQSKYSNRKFCSAECRFRGLLPSVFSDEECVIWPKSCNLKTGYGQFQPSESPGAMIGAHRFAYTSYVGPIPDGLYVCHKCDNRRCVNPLHLFLGSQEDNVRDMWSKGRQQKYENQPLGESNPASRLTAEEVMSIYLSLEKTEKLTAKYGVSRGAIDGIRVGRNWKWLTSQAT